MPGINKKLSSVETEEIVLGCILAAFPSGNAALEQIPFLESDDFTELINVWIFQAMRDLRRKRLDIDEQSVGDELKLAGHLEDIGRSALPGPYDPHTEFDVAGRMYLKQLQNNQFALATYHIETYARVVETCSRKRKAVALAGEIAQTAIEQPNELLLPTAMKLIEMLQRAEAKTADDPMRANLVHVSELKNLPPLAWLLPGEIPKYGLVLVYGPSGVGKSFFALDYALRLAEDVCVVYIATEGEAGFSMRVAAWARHHQKNVDRFNLFFYMNIVALLEERERSEFTNLIHPLHPQLLIVDTLAHSMLPGNENDTRDMGLFLRASKKIQKELGCAIVMVHHTNKSSDYERGSSALRGACDMMIRLDEEDEIITVQCAKSKDATPFPTRYIRLLPVKLEDGQSSPVLIPAEKIKQTAQDALSPMQRQVLEAFGLEAFAVGATMTDIAEVTKIARGTVQKVASRLARLGFLIRTNNGGYQISDQGRQRLTPDSSLTPVSDSSESPAKFEVTPVTPPNHDTRSSESGVSGVSGVRYATSDL